MADRYCFVPLTLKTGIYLLYLAVCSVFSCAAAELPAPTIVKYALPNNNLDPVANYHVRLLSAALAHSDKTFVLKPVAEHLVQSRALREINHSGTVDVYWSMTTTEREQTLRPVRIPIDKGLLGWRLLLVKPESTPVISLDNIFRLRLAQGHDWPDTEILQQAGFKVETSSDFNSLFSMVQKGRADALPRSVIEIDHELKNIAAGLSIAPGVMLYYPTAQYFFVAEDNEELAFYLEQGLRRIISNGVFDRLYYQEFGPILERLQHEQRLVIFLKNPTLPANTALDKPELWQALPEHYRIIKD